MKSTNRDQTIFGTVVYSDHTDALEDVLNLAGDL